MTSKALNIIVLFLLPIRHPSKDHLTGIESQPPLGENVRSGSVVIDDPEVPETKPMGPFFDKNAERFGTDKLDRSQICIQVFDLARGDQLFVDQNASPPSPRRSGIGRMATFPSGR